MGREYSRTGGSGSDWPRAGHEGRSGLCLLGGDSALHACAAYECGDPLKEAASCSASLLLTRVAAYLVLKLAFDDEAKRGEESHTYSHRNMSKVP